MESATLRRSPPPLPALIQLVLVGALFGLAALAWALTSRQMAGMDAGPGTDPGGLAFFLVTWVVMMAAMMFPSITPMVLMFARIQEGRRERGDSVPATLTALFVGGYLVSWAAAGLFAYGLFRLGRATVGGAFSWDAAGPYLAGGVIVAAGVYQLTPLKEVCLRYCRSPITFFMTHSKPGRAGALRMGIEHGGFCVGCCWMLMAALFALGVMSIGWMAFIAALIALEKLLPAKDVANRGIAVLLVALGVAIAIVPSRVPGLTEPGSAAAMRAMRAMGMPAAGAEMKPSDGAQMKSSKGGRMKSGPMHSSAGNSSSMSH